MASLGTWPSAYVPISFRMELQTNQRVNAAPGGGSEQAVDMLNDRWMVYMTLPQANSDDAAEIEALVASFRGQVNTVDLWHMGRPAPRGTIAGTPTLAADVAQGASSIQVQTSGAGITVKSGDLLGVGGLLLMAAPGLYTADGTGKVTVSLANRVRSALSSGAAVTWDKPAIPFRLLTTSGVGHVGGLISEEVTLTLGEKI